MHLSCNLDHVVLQTCTCVSLYVYNSIFRGSASDATGEFMMLLQASKLAGEGDSPPHSLPPQHLCHRDLVPLAPSAYRHLFVSKKALVVTLVQVKTPKM